MSMTWDFILRLFIAGALGAVIGLDREYRAKEAGYRTHFLVSLGSALIMIVSQYGFMEVVKMEGIDLDPSRVAAQVVSGIGFIGAGTIFFRNKSCAGLLPLPEFGLLRASVWLLEPVCTGWESQQQSLR